ncbi:hypothetical protein Hanom_Chr05g00410381 [Helianthus anomalus]
MQTKGHFKRDRWNQSEDEGFNWSKYIPDEGPSAFIAKWVYNREEEIARKKLGDIEMIYIDAVDYNRWDEE